jgi:16S rRNA (guanine527-N7)-methyltransferase
MKDEALLAGGIGELGLAVPRHIIDSLLAYAAILARWNRVFNLTRIAAGPATIIQHLLDSLAIVPHIRGETIIDVGSGGGLPGIPLALLFPAKRVTLLDSNGKKTRFLQHLKIQLQLENVLIVQARAEDFRGEFDVVTCRALASLSGIATLTAHMLGSESRLLAMKGALSEGELAEDVSPLVIESVTPLPVPGVLVPRQLVVMSLAARGATIP